MGRRYYEIREDGYYFPDVTLEVIVKEGTEYRFFEALLLLCAETGIFKVWVGFEENDLAKADRLGTRGVLISDLRRSAFTSAGVALLTATLYREEMTRVDARLSAERAFSFEEMGDLARGAGWRDYAHRRMFPAWQFLAKEARGMAVSGLDHSQPGT